MQIMKPPQIEITPEYLREQGLSESFPRRFWAKVDVRGPDDCWPWLATLHQGYGWIYRGYSRFKPATVMPAHVASWILCRGPVPAGLFVLHKCPTGHNRACVNPAHLKPGTKSENGKDSMEQGTCWLCHRQDRFRSKLTQAIADEIRKRYTGTRGEQAALGREFGVSRHAVRLIVHGQAW